MNEPRKRSPGKRQVHVPKRSMTNEARIAAVFKFPCIWDKTFVDYRRKEQTAQAWRDVADMFISETRTLYVAISISS